MAASTKGGGIALLLSIDRKAIKWRTIGAGLAIQLVFAFIVLKWEFGREMLMGLSDAVQKLVSYANEGVVFVFGGLADAENVGDVEDVYAFFNEKMNKLFAAIRSFESPIAYGLISENGTQSLVIGVYSSKKIPLEGIIEGLIDGADVRKQLIYAFEMLYYKEVDEPDRKHYTVR